MFFVGSIQIGPQYRSLANSNSAYDNNKAFFLLYAVYYAPQSFFMARAQVKEFRVRGNVEWFFIKIVKVKVHNIKVRL